MRETDDASAMECKLQHELDDKVREEQVPVNVYPLYELIRLKQLWLMLLFVCECERVERGKSQSRRRGHATQTDIQLQTILRVSNAMT